MNVVVNAHGNITQRTDDPSVGVPLPDGFVASPFDTYWDGSHFVSYTEEQKAAKGRQMILNKEWSNTTMTWEDSRSISQVKADQHLAVKEARQLEINSPLTTPYGVFQCRPEDRQNLADAVLLAKSLSDRALPSDTVWTLADNSVVTLTLEQLIDVGLLLGARTQSAHAKSRILRQNIDEASTTEAVLAVIW